MHNSFIKIIVISDRIFIKMVWFFFAEPYNESRRKGVRVYVSNTPIFTNGALCYTSQIQVMKTTKIYGSDISVFTFVTLFYLFDIYLVEQQILYTTRHPDTE